MKPVFKVSKKENDYLLQVVSGKNTRTVEIAEDVAIQCDNKKFIGSLAKALNAEKAVEVREGCLVPNPELEAIPEYFIIYIHLIGYGRDITKWEDYIRHTIQWDTTFRCSPDPHVMAYQKGYYNRSVDLPLNYAERLEDIDADLRVPDSIVNSYVGMLPQLGPLQWAVIGCLTAMYGSVTLAIELITKQIDASNYSEATLAATSGT